MGKLYCLNCGKEFEGYKNVKKFCSIQCNWYYKCVQIRKYKGQHISEKCKCCGKIFEKKKINHTFCSRFCMDKSKNSIWKPKNIQHIKDYRKMYYSLNKEKIIKHWLDYKKEHYGIDLDFTIKERLRSRLRIAFNKYCKNNNMPSSKHKNINYGLIIKKLINTKPDNIDGYHIDHIIPLSKFDLTNDSDIKMAMSPDNIQWLLAKDNLSKGARI